QALGLDWGRYLRPAGLDTAEVVIGQPSFFTELGAAITEVPLDDWKAYLRFTLIDHYAPYLSGNLADAAFAFHGRLLQGREVERERWRRAVEVLSSTMGECGGRRYVERHFAPSAKKRMDELVADLRTAFGTSIDELDWMSQTTKA